MSNQMLYGYFDYAASYPVREEALMSYNQAAIAHFANPSSIHLYGKEARQQLLIFRKALCDLVNFPDGRFLLTSSGSEANNTVIEGHMAKFPKAQLLIAEDVHDSIWYAMEGYSKAASSWKIDQNGHLSSKDLEERLKKAKITMVCMSHVCNETGVIHDVNSVAEICHRNSVLLLIDGMQALGYLHVNLSELPCTYYTISGHKIGSVKGIAGVFLRDNSFMPLIRGGRQEWGLRAGTEDLAGLVSMVKAAGLAIDDIESESDKLRKIKLTMIERLSALRKVRINTPSDSAPGILSVSINGISGRELVAALSMHGFAVSTGSACHANEMEPSRIILAMGRSREEAIGTIRISMGKFTTMQAANELIDHLIECIR